MAPATLAQQARNIQITSDGLIVATQSGGLLLQRDTNPPFEIPLPPSVSNFDDISLSEDDTALFALSTTSRTVCSFSRAGDAFTLVGCEAPGFNVNPFSGISARDGVCVISGGTGGFTVMEYSRQTAEFDPALRALNRVLPNVIGHPDVQLVNANLAAMSTDFADSSSAQPRFGTMMVDLNTLSESHNFRVADSLEFNLFVSPTNFPIVNSFYEDDAGRMYMYTANGGMTVQDPFTAGTTEIIQPRSGFRAVTASVDQENGLLVVGGIQDGSQSLVLEYSVSSNPFAPVLVKETEVNGRLTSVAANGGVIAYVGSDVSGIEIVSSRADPSVPPVSSNAPSTSPSRVDPSVSPVLTNVPSASPGSGEEVPEPVPSSPPSQQPVECLPGCQNGGICVSVPSNSLRKQQSCECAQGFEGPFCQFPVSEQPDSSSSLAPHSFLCAGLAVTIWLA